MLDGEPREGALRAEADNWLELEKAEFISRWYETEYKDSTYSGGAGYVQALMHRSLERGYDAQTTFNRTLELGGNRGEHLQFVRHSYGSYVLTDVAIRMQPPDLRNAPGRTLQLCEADAQWLPFTDGSFDRVVHACLLHHVLQPEDALREIRRVLKPGGTADIFVSSDPGLLFRIARRLGPARTAKGKGLGQVKRLVDARDHINHVGALRALIRHVFRGDVVQERRYPLGLPGWNMSLWHTYRIRKALITQS